MEYKPKTIYCPKCGRKVATWDGRSSSNITVKCRKCNKMVVFRPKTMETELKPLPQRNTASGVTFI